MTATRAGPDPRRQAARRLLDLLFSSSLSASICFSTCSTARSLAFSICSSTLDSHHDQRGLALVEGVASSLTSLRGHPVPEKPGDAAGDAEDCR